MWFIDPYNKTLPILWIIKDLTSWLPKEQSSSWEANSHSASQEMPYLLWNREVHSSVLDPILSQINPVNIFQLYFI
jgi:hypothetical protein